MTEFLKIQNIVGHIVLCSWIVDLFQKRNIKNNGGTQNHHR